MPQQTQCRIGNKATGRLGQAHLERLFHSDRKFINQLNLFYTC